MYSLIFLGFVSFALSLILTPLVRKLALHLGLVDQPDGIRKVHKVPIPRIGGIAIVAAIMGAYGLLLLARLHAGHIIWSGVPFAIRFVPAVIVIFGVGLMDDIFNIRPWTKLTGEVIAATLIWTVGIRLGAIDGHPFSVLFSFVATVVWIVACSNAVNLIDGIDGLATGVGLFATITTLIAALLHHNIGLAFATVPLAGALLGFLRFNFSPASIYLGDCGSLTIGFLLGCYGILWSEKSTTLLSMTAPLLALSLPLVDESLAIARRYLRQQPIFSADRAHIHHKLLARGMTPRRVVLVLYGVCGLAAAAALLFMEAREQYRGFVIVLVCLAALLGLQHLGYSEFRIAGKLALGGAFHRHLNAQLALISFEEKLSEATTLDQCWELLCRSCPQFGFSGIELDLDGVLRHGKTTGGWSVHIDLPGQGHINLIRAYGTKKTIIAATLFIDCISRVFGDKLDELESSRFEMTAYDELESSWTEMTAYAESK
jgi:UDP-GlcNAc:undecaprenyl-phosphate GlcNAc-1-phosphate transferase